MAVYEAPGVEDARDEVNPLLPPGVYPGEIISAKFDDITNTDSKYYGVTMLKYVIKAEGDEFSASVFGNIFMPHESMDEDAIQRGLAQIKRLQIACGLEPTSLVDDEAFLHCQLQVEVGIKKGKDGYADQNIVRDVLPA